MLEKKEVVEVLKAVWPCFIALALSLSVTLYYPVPVGQDIWFHLGIARGWARGELAGWGEEVLRINGMPYPPLFHWLLVPSVWLGVEAQFARLLQVVCYPLTLFLLLSALRRLNVNSRDIAFVGCVALSSFAFFDRVIQAQPQALDFVFLSLSLYGYASKRPYLFWLPYAGLVWNHGLVGFLFASIPTGLFVREKLSLREWRSPRVSAMLLSVALSAPVGFLLLPYFGSVTAIMGGGSQNLQEAQLWSSPLFYTLTYAGSALIGAIPLLARSVQRRIGSLGRFCLLGLLSSVAMFPFWPDRTLQYASLFLSLGFGLGDWLEREKVGNLALLYFFVLMLGAWVPWVLLAVDGYHVVMP